MRYIFSPSASQRALRFAPQVPTCQSYFRDSWVQHKNDAQEAWFPNRYRAVHRKRSLSGTSFFCYGTFRPQVTTDAYRPYLQAIEDAFGTEVDYAQLHKIYGAPTPDESRYSPATCIGCDMKTVMGDPDPKHVSTSFVERQNLTMRMSMRRFTRLTNGFSKKLENHGHAVALHYMHYNFCRVHKTLRVTPAMEAGLTDHVWALDELINLLNTKENG